MSKFSFLFTSLIFLCLSCQRDECPESFIIEQDPIPLSVNNRIRYRDIDTLRFVSENHDTVEYEKYYGEIDNVVLEPIEPVTCDYDPSQKVEIYYERIWNKMY